MASSKLSHGAGNVELTNYVLTFSYFLILLRKHQRSLEHSLVKEFKCSMRLNTSCPPEICLHSTDNYCHQFNSNLKHIPAYVHMNLQLICMLFTCVVES